ncbi:PAS domain-containing protein [Rhodoblastus sp.]|jgi:hypothetical protein|uniref:PAS domain-containing protein n=1 Tax=Rhodoblastus sp. TaxID=1962975 RepID=UPI0026222EAD|nr:PAS domain-containing protein [Rhodoblastus sp.]
MRQAATQELYAYWNRLRGARLSPEREEIDPSAIRHILADTMILEVDEERRFPVRISGSRLNALFLDEQKGRPFVELFAPDERAMAAQMISDTIDGVRPIVAGLTAGIEDDLPAHLELLLLPLRHHGKTHARVLGMLTPIALPPWLGLRRADCLRLVSMRFIDEEQAAALSFFPPRDNGSLDQPSDLARRTKTRRRSFFVIPGGRG